MDIFSVCSLFDNLEIAAVPFKTQGLRGIARLADDSSPINCILVNSNLSYEEQNFHGFHELMHIYRTGDCPGATFSCYDRLKPNQNGYVEWIANEGAAELILPHDVLLPYIKEHAVTFNSNMFAVSDMVEKISIAYRVSPMVVTYRLESLKYEIQQYLTGAQLSEIRILSKNQQEKLGIKIDSLIDIEGKRLLLSFSESSAKLSRPFFDYSDSYRGMLA